MGNEVSNLADGVAHLATDVANEVAHVATDVANDVAHVATDVANDVAHVATDVANDVAHISTDVANEVAHITTDVANDVAHVATDVANDVAHISTDVANDVAHVATDVANEVAHSTTDVANEVAHVATNVANVVAHVATDVANMVAETATKIVDEVVEIGAEVIDGTIPIVDVLVPAANLIPDKDGTCLLLPNVNIELRELKSLKKSVGEQFPGSSANLDYIEKQRWMEHLGPQQLPINMIVWPGTHDSATYDIGIPFITRPFAQCQSLSTYQQLRSGVRAFDIRIQKDKLIVHGPVLANYGIDVVINDIKKFLGETNLDILLLEIRTEYGETDPPNFQEFLIEQLSEFLIPENDQVFSKTIVQVLPKRIICVWKPRNSEHPKQGGPLWDESYVRDNWINTDMPLTKFNGNIKNLKGKVDVLERKYFYRVEHTLTAQTDNPAEFVIWWTKDIEVLTRRIRMFARVFLAKCHEEGILDKLQIFSADFISDDFIYACIQLNRARLNWTG